MNPLDWFRWLRAWVYIWCVHFFEWQKWRATVEADANTLRIVKEVIERYKEDVEIIRAGKCEECRSFETVIVKTNANSPLAHDFLCAGCWLGRLLGQMGGGTK